MGRTVPYLAVDHRVRSAGENFVSSPLSPLSLKTQEPSSCRPYHLSGSILQYFRILPPGSQPRQRLEDPRWPRPTSFHDLEYKVPQLSGLAHRSPRLSLGVFIA